ncbi:hypothetical protein PIROE2DRAFT_7959 [Piromyces sp. E2]|nr:hypothetical protein PIROE2DRAFT_7959 [Piromyces sp. E2]|eukprot:OUM65071.1 hypothetical protein PIROE2DRAFT_7959 [Piromyces sp. E2]
MNKNENDNNDNYPLLASLSNEICVKKLETYISFINTTLKIHKSNKNGDYPFLMVFKTNNIDNLKYLISYAKQHNININYNKTNKDSNYPMLEVSQ